MAMRHVLIALVVASCLAAAASAAAALAANDRVGALFVEALDADGDGVMRVAELRAFVARIEPDVTLAHVRSLFETMDGDRDGGVTLAEFKARFPRLSDERRYRNETAPEQVHLHCTTDPSEMVVIWVTFVSTGAHLVEYGTAPGVYTARTGGYEYVYRNGIPTWPGFLHRVLLSGLRPGTRYYYRVGDGATWSPEFNFVALPSPGQGEGLSYVAYGDMGTFMLFGLFVTDEIVRVDQEQDYSMVFHLGDVSYAGGGVLGFDQELSAIWDVWGRQVEPIAAYYPYMISLGNHESAYNYSAHNSRHEMPGAGSGGDGNNYFSFDYGLVHFVSMSSENDAAPYAVGSPQHNWLRQDLAKANANRDRVPWIVMGGHRPMYGSSEAGSWEGIRTAIEPLLKEFQVDLFVAGHVHLYERSHAVYDNVVTDLPDANEVYRSPQSTIHITVGTAGAIVIDRYEPQPAWSAKRLRNYGWSDFRATRTQLTYTFRSGTSGPDWPEGDGERKVTDVFYIVKDAPQTA